MRRGVARAASSSEAWSARKIYGEVLCRADCATLDDLREAVTTLEETLLLARRVLGRTHPITGLIDKELRNARAALRAREAGKRVVFEYK